MRTLSDEGAQASKHGSVETKLCTEDNLSVDGHVRLVVHFSELGDISVHQVQSETLDSVVELVSHEVLAEALHSVVGVVSMLHTIHVFVALNDVETVSKGLSVEEGVKGVAADTQNSWGTLAHTWELLFGQVIWKLG